jgi:hypothetical protein
MGLFLDKVDEKLGQKMAFRQKEKAPGGRGALFLAFQALSIQKIPEGGCRAICGSVASQRRLASTCPCCASSAELEAFFAANLTAAFGVLTLVS